MARWTATYENDRMGYNADDWADALEQALGHEGDDTGDLTSVEREPDSVKPGVLVRDDGTLRPVGHHLGTKNRVRQEGVDRCPCGSKYWENDRCIDCGGTEIEETSDGN